MDLAPLFALSLATRSPHCRAALGRASAKATQTGEREGAGNAVLQQKSPCRDDGATHVVMSPLVPRTCLHLFRFPESRRPVPACVPRSCQVRRANAVITPRRSHTLRRTRAVVSREVVYESWFS